MGRADAKYTQTHNASVSITSAFLPSKRMFSHFIFIESWNFIAKRDLRYHQVQNSYITGEETETLEFK